MKQHNESDPRRPLKLIKVGVFPPDEGSRTYMAYTLWYNPRWPRCCEHEVEAVNGTEAKKIAIREHKERCESDAGLPPVCANHCGHDVRFLNGDPVHVTERLVWCTYEDKDGYCGHTCKDGVGCE